MSVQNIFKSSLFNLIFCLSLVQLYGADELWETLQYTGPAELRLDVALLAVDYSPQQFATAERRAQQVVASLQDIEPFTNYRKYINFYLKILNLEESKLISVNLSEKNILTCDADQALDKANSAPDADIVMVLTNTPNGRSTAFGKVITLASKGGLDDVFTHEMGHAFGHLADEYEDPIMAQKRDISEVDHFVNTTKELNVKLSKWHYWTIGKWPGPHMMMDLPSGHRITHKEGAFYLPKGVFRPETNCKMRDHRCGQYCVVCAEEIEKQFFIHIDPIQNYWPASEKIALWAEENLKVGATVIDVKASGGKVGKFVTTWYLDGQHLPAINTLKNSEVTLNAKQLGKGIHELALRVDFVNGNVRKDNGWLSSSKVWTVLVNEFPEPNFNLKDKLKFSNGQLVKFEKGVDYTTSENGTCTWTGLPQGAKLHDHNWEWKIPENNFGAWEIQLSHTLGGQTKTQSVVIFVSRNVNRLGAFTLPEFIEIASGETWLYPIDYSDPENDSWVLEIEGMPMGMEYDQAKKTLKWNVPMIFNNCVVKITLFDGSSRLTKSLELRRKNQVHSDMEKVPVEIGLRSPLAQTRFHAMQNSSKKCTSFQILNFNRLLRDSEPQIVNQACRLLNQTLSKHLDYREMFFEDVEPYLWDLSDQPKILDWVKILAQEDVKKKSSLLKTLYNIEKYNLNRGPQ